MRISTLALGLVLVAAGFAWGAPGYYVTELVGLTYGGGPNAWAGTLLSNGTVVGGTEGAPPAYSLCTWSSSGASTNVYTVSNPVEFAWGDNAGQIVADQQGTVYVWNGTTYAKTDNSNLTETSPAGVSSGGLVFGYNNAATVSWAYDLNTSRYYTVATSSSGDTWPTGANAAGYVVGSTNGLGYVWQESNQSYSTISGASALNGISENSQYLAGETTGGQAALYSPSGTLLGSYWSGEATFVNDNGLVVGDTTTIDGGGGNSNPRAMAYINGQTVDLTTAYAPAGVTFVACDGLNDVGQILVSNSYSVAVGVEIWLLTPALPGDANLDGKVDVNDLTIVLTNFGQTGMSWETGDFTGDGKVDVNDLTIVLAHFGQSSGSIAAGPAAVPEPGMLAIVATALVGLLVYAARRRH
jgi:hypothetical protein